MPPVAIACLVAHSVVAHLAANRSQKLALKYMKKSKKLAEMNGYLIDIVVRNECTLDNFDAIALTTMTEEFNKIR